MCVFISLCSPLPSISSPIMWLGQHWDGYWIINAAYFRKMYSGANHAWRHDSQTGKWNSRVLWILFTLSHFIIGPPWILEYCQPNPNPFNLVLYQHALPLCLCSPSGFCSDRQEVYYKIDKVRTGPFSQLNETIVWWHSNKIPISNTYIFAGKCFKYSNSIRGKNAIWNEFPISENCSNNFHFFRQRYMSEMK